MFLEGSLWESSKSQLATVFESPFMAAGQLGFFCAQHGGYSWFPSSWSSSLQVSASLRVTPACRTWVCLCILAQSGLEWSPDWAAVQARPSWWAFESFLLVIVGSGSQGSRSRGPCSQFHPGSLFAILFGLVLPNWVRLDKDRRAVQIVCFAVPSGTHRLSLENTI